MMARRGILGLMAAGAALFLPGCSALFPPSYRFRMTVNVQTPEGLRSGSSVYEVEAFGTKDLITGSSGSRAQFRGEAIAVDLPGNRTLFAILKSVHPLHDFAKMSMAALDPAFDYKVQESVSRISSREGIEFLVQLEPDNYPMLVTFTDPGDPASVIQIMPDRITDSFGEGYRVESITLEVTDDHVTRKFAERIKMQGLEEGHGLDRTRGVTASPTLAQQLSYNDFVGDWK